MWSRLQTLRRGCRACRIEAARVRRRGPRAEDPAAVLDQLGLEGTPHVGEAMALLRVALPAALDALGPRADLARLELAALISVLVALTRLLVALGLGLALDGPERPLLPEPDRAPPRPPPIIATPTIRTNAPNASL